MEEVLHVQFKFENGHACIVAQLFITRLCIFIFNVFSVDGISDFSRFPWICMKAEPFIASIEDAVLFSF